MTQMPTYRIKQIVTDEGVSCTVEVRQHDRWVFEARYQTLAEAESSIKRDTVPVLYYDRFGERIAR